MGVPLGTRHAGGQRVIGDACPALGEPSQRGSGPVLARGRGPHASGGHEGPAGSQAEGDREACPSAEGTAFRPPKLPLRLDSGCSRGPGSCVGRTYTCRLARSVAHVQERTLQVAFLPPRHTGRRLPGDLAGARSTPTVSPFSVRRGVFSRRRTPCAALSRGQKVPERWSVASAPVAAEVPGEALS